MGAPRIFTFAKWNLEISILGISLTLNGDTIFFKVNEIDNITLSTNLLDNYLIITLKDPAITPFALTNITTAKGEHIIARFNEYTKELEHIKDELIAIKKWHSDLKSQLDKAYSQDNWLLSSNNKKFTKYVRKSPKYLLDNYSKEDIKAIAQTYITNQSFFEVIEDYLLTYPKIRANYLKAKYEEILARDEEFFNVIEKSPLTMEQRYAVINYNDRTLVNASAGSGKTSVMVAKYAYLIKNKLLNPEEILVLAFNKSTTIELKERINARLQRFGINIPTSSINVFTFHGFSYNIIRKLLPTQNYRTGEFTKPEKLLFLKETINSNLPFKITLLSYLFLQVEERAFYKKPKIETLAQKLKDYLKTLLKQEFAPKYTVTTKNFTISLTNEKKTTIIIRVHKENPGFKKENPKVLNLTLIDFTRPIILLRVIKFLLKTKVLTLNTTLFFTDHMLPVKYLDLVISEFCLKHEFKQTYQNIENYFQQSNWGNVHNYLLIHLCAFFEKHYKKLTNKISFAELISGSVKILTTNHVILPFKYIMVDEAQDMSPSRASLIKALLQNEEVRLFAVGDDWQSINLYAGSVIEIMTKFNKHFGECDTLELNQGFRCNPDITQIASNFIQKNPFQLRKTPHSLQKAYPNPTMCLSLPTEDDFLVAIYDICQDIINSDECKDDNHVSIMVLGRYKILENLTHPAKALRTNKFSISFSTIHSAKGLEADYIIIPGLTKSGFGFPTSRDSQDDVRHLYISPDTYPQSEERRLFYVALTRAKRRIFLLSVRNNKSSFLEEIQKDCKLNDTIFVPKNESNITCQTCKEGKIYLITNKDGAVHYCSNPDCPTYSNKS